MEAAPFRLTERAAARIAQIAAGGNGPTGPAGGAGPARGAGPAGAALPVQALRVAVLAGGCSGFQYRFELTQAPAEDDIVIEQGGAKVLIDPVSMDLLAGSELDFTDALMGSHFAVRNPQATSACGCGTSFSVD
jgi:iron-sulfur cluster assembly accessory protein